MSFWSKLFSGVGSTLAAGILAGLVLEAKAEIDKGKLKAAEKAIAKAGVDLLAERVAAKLVK